MKLKNEVFAQNDFMISLNNLNKCKALPVGTFVSVLKMSQDLDENRKVFEAAKKDILEKYGEEKDGGYAVPEDAPQDILEIINSEFKILTDIEFEIKAEKVQVSRKLLQDLSKSEAITPHDILCLKEVLDTSQIWDKKEKKGKKK